MAAGNYEQAGFVRSRARAPGTVQTVMTQAEAAARRAVPPPSSPKPTINRINVDLSIARTETGIGAAAPLLINTSGTHVWAAWATDGDALLQMQIGDQPYIPFAMNHAVEGFAFDRLRVINGQQPGKTITLVIINDPTLNANVE